MKSILFVCIGNMARSPMAEHRLKQDLDNLGVTGINVESAGTHDGIAGYRADPRAIQVMNNRGISLHNHRARPLQKEMLAEFDLIICLDREAYLKVKSSVNGSDKPRVILKEVQDPRGMGLSEFERCASNIDELSSELSTLLARDFTSQD